MLRGDRPQRLPRAIPGVTRGHAGRQNRAQSAQPHAVHGRAARPPVRGGAATRAACDGGGSIDEAALEALGLAHLAEQALEHLRALGRPKQLWKPRVVAPSWRRRVEERDQVLGLSGAVRLDEVDGIGRLIALQLRPLRFGTAVERAALHVDAKVGATEELLLQKRRPPIGGTREPGMLAHPRHDQSHARPARAKDGRIGDAPVSIRDALCVAAAAKAKGGRHGRRCAPKLPEEDEIGGGGHRRWREPWADQPVQNRDERHSDRQEDDLEQRVRHKVAHVGACRSSLHVTLLVLTSGKGLRSSLGSDEVVFT